VAHLARLPLVGQGCRERGGQPELLIQLAYQKQPTVTLDPRRVESYGDSVRRVERKAEARNTVCHRLGGPGWL
jgi:hypothetical protein